MSRLPRPLIILAILAFLIVSLSGTALAFSPDRTTVTSITTITTSGQEILTFDAATCTALKAAFPQRASDPTLCQYTHYWKETIMRSSATSTSCPTGTVWFWDADSDGVFYSLDLNTEFHWAGNCQQPIGVSEDCFPDWLIDTTVSNPSCYGYDYIGSRKSHAYVYTVFLTINPGGFSYSRWESQRRECYNDALGDCYWYSWIGK
jgi:hypothetical protein